MSLFLSYTPWSRLLSRRAESRENRGLRNISTAGCALSRAAFSPCLGVWAVLSPLWALFIALPPAKSLASGSGSRNSLPALTWEPFRAELLFLQVYSFIYKQVYFWMISFSWNNFLASSNRLLLRSKLHFSRTDSISRKTVKITGHVTWENLWEWLLH